MITGCWSPNFIKCRWYPKTGFDLKLLSDCNQVGV